MDQKECGCIKISIIIPTYNSSNYVEILLDSLKEQTFKYFEILLVDDCSTDDTVNKIIKFRNNNLSMNILFIQKAKNRGVSDSRNIGIMKSSADFIVFIDSDDYVSSDYLEKLYNKAVSSKADIVMCGFDKVFPSKELILRYADRYKYFNSNSRSREVLYEFVRGGIYFRTGNFIVKKEILVKNDIWFSTNLKYGEDQEVFMKMLYYSNEVECVKESMYFYVNWPSSTINNYANLNYLNLLKSIKKCIDLFSNQKEPDRYLIKLLKCNKMPRTIILILSDWAKAGVKSYYTNLISRRVVRYYLFTSIRFLSEPSPKHIKIILKSLALLLFPKIYYQLKRNKQ